jgi:zinc protease
VSDGGDGRAYAPDRSAAPPPRRRRGFAFPPFTRRRLPGGTTVLAARQARAPRVKLEILFPAGAARVPADSAGLAALCAMLLDDGTDTRNALDIAAAVERLGGRLATGADWDSAYLAVELLARHAGEGLELLAELATRPAFPPEEIERLRRQRLAELLRRQSDPGFLARRVFSRALYGNTTYGLPGIGTEASLGAIDREAIEAFYRDFYPPPGATVVAVGDLDPDDTAAAVAEALDRGGEPPPPPPGVEPVPLEGVEVHLVDRPGAAQTQLVIGHAGVPRSHPDWLVLTVTNSILGGKFTSRINLNLRERHGYTYGASSRFDGRLGPGPFAVVAAVANPVAGAAAREVIGEIARIREAPVETEELDDSRNYITGVFPYTLQTAEGLAQRLESLAVYDLPDDYYAQFPARVQAVTREQVLDAARRHLHPDRLAVVAVGPAAELEPQLAELGPVTVHTAASPPAEMPAAPVAGGPVRTG